MSMQRAAHVLTEYLRGEGGLVGIWVFSSHLFVLGLVGTSLQGLGFEDYHFIPLLQQQAILLLPVDLL